MLNVEQIYIYIYSQIGLYESLFVSGSICSIHFEADSFEIPMKQRLLQYNPKNSRNLRVDAVPVLNLPGSFQKPNNTERSSRISKRRHHSIVTEMLKESICLDPQPSTSKEESHLQPSTSKESQASSDQIMVDIAETIDNSISVDTTVGINKSE